MRRSGPSEQMPGPLRRADDPWGIVWRLTNLARRASLRRTVRFVRALASPVRHERPIFVLGVPRSGTSLVFRLLAASSALGALPREGHDLWRAFHHPRYSGWRSDDVGPGAVRPGERRFVDAYLSAHFPERRFVEKTPENSLRVPYLLDLYPDASFVVVWRDPLDVVSSLVEGWRDPQGRFRSYFVPERLESPGYPHPRRWCFALIEGWRELRTEPIPSIAFEQWRTMAEALVGARGLVAPERWTEIHLEDLLASPELVLDRLVSALDLPPEPILAETLAGLIERPVNALSVGGDGPDRRRRTREEVSVLLPRIRPLAERIGRLPGDDAGAGGRS